MTADFTLERIDFDFKRVEQIIPVRIEYARAFNTVGKLVISCSDDYPRELFFGNAMWRLFRQPRQGPISLEPDALWFTRLIRHDYAQREWIITAFDQNWLLDQRLVGYRSQTTLGDKTFEEGTDGPIDDLMKAFVRENLTAPVIEETLAPDTNRDSLAPYLEVAADESLAPVGEISGSFTGVLEVLNSLASQAEDKGTTLFYDVEVTDDNKFRFVTKLGTRGVNLADQNVEISENDRVLDNLVTEEDYQDEITMVYIGGQDSGGGKNIIQRISSRASNDPFSRIEAYFDLGGEYIDTYYEDQGDALLQGGRPRKRIFADLLDSDIAIYGRDIFYGDYVKVSVDGDTYSCHLSAINNVVEDGDENLRIRLEGEIVL